MFAAEGTLRIPEKYQQILDILDYTKTIVCLYFRLVIILPNNPCCAPFIILIISDSQNGNVFEISQIGNINID